MPWDRMLLLLRRGSIAYKAPEYEALISKLPIKPEEVAEDRIQLLWPRQAAK